MTRIKEIENCVRALYSVKSYPALVYHNLSHTESVVSHTAEIAAHYKIDGDSLFVLMSAAWFHDTGHLLGEMETHEERSIAIMQYFFANTSISPQIVAEIADCIMSTKMQSHPQTILQMILCDADTYHLGTPEFFNTDTLVWEELELRTHKKYEHKTASSIQFLEKHQYFTDYCVSMLNDGKRNNLNRLRMEYEKQDA